MSTRQSRRERADSLTQRQLLDLGAEFRDARIAGGLSLDAVGEVVGVSGTHVGRLEHGRVGEASLMMLNRLAQVHGHRLSLKLYPDGDPLRDASQNRLLGRLRPRLHPSCGWRTEVPVHASTSLRAWDAVVTCGAERTAIEAETRIRDGQALTRRLMLKLETDRTIGQLVLLVADTRANRTALELLRADLREAFPLDTRAVLAAFARGVAPRGNGIVIL